MTIEVRLRVVIIMLALSVVVATGFYNISESWGLLDSLYFSISTATTVGYGDLVPTSDASKIFTIIYTLVSVSLALYAIALVAQRRIIFHLNLHHKKLKQAEKKNKKH